MGFRQSIDFILVLRKLWPVNLTRHFRQEDQNQPAKGRVYILAFSQSSHIQFYNKDITHDQPYYPNVINIHIYKLIKSKNIDNYTREQLWKYYRKKSWLICEKKTGGNLQEKKYFREKKMSKFTNEIFANLQENSISILQEILWRITVKEI